MNDMNFVGEFYWIPPKKKFFLIFLDIRFQLNEQLKCLEQRIETQLSILTEIQEYFRRRADVELDYAKNLDNLHKQIGQKHRAQKAKWIFSFEKNNAF